MFGKKYHKEMIGASVGASIMPVALESIDSADMGPLGKASKVAVVGGFALKLGKKVF